MSLVTLVGNSRPAAIEMPCKFCGCTDAHGCLDVHGAPCFWLHPGICSACARKRWLFIEPDDFYRLLRWWGFDDDEPFPGLGTPDCSCSYCGGTFVDTNNDFDNGLHLSDDERGDARLCYYCRLQFFTTVPGYELLQKHPGLA